MHLIKINNDEYSLPSCWNELTLKQLLYLSHLSKEKNLPVQKLTTHLVLYCLGAHVTNDSRVFGRKIRLKLGKESYTVRMQIGKRHYDLEPSAYTDLGDLMNFILNVQETSLSQLKRRHNFNIEAEYEYQIAPELTICPCSKVRVGWHILSHRGDPSLMDITFEQYMYLQTYISGLRTGKSTIEDVLACIWHRGKHFKMDRHDKDAALLRKLSEDMKTVMLWFISSCLADFTEQFPRLFRAEGGSENGGNILDAQLRMLDLLADHDVTKKDRIRESVLFDVFYSLDEMIRENEHLAEKMKKNS